MPCVVYWRVLFWYRQSFRDTREGLREGKGRESKAHGCIPTYLDLPVGISTGVVEGLADILKIDNKLSTS